MLCGLANMAEPGKFKAQYGLTFLENKIKAKAPKTILLLEYVYL